MAYDLRKSLGSMTLDEIPDAPILPTGHYYLVVRRNEFRYAVKTKTGPEVDIVEVYVGVQRPAADVDPNKLDGIDLSSIELRHTLWDVESPRGKQSVREYMRGFGFSGGIPVEALWHETIGRELLGAVSHRTYMSNRSGKMESAANLDKVAPVPEEATTDLSSAAN